MPEVQLGLDGAPAAPERPTDGSLEAVVLSELIAWDRERPITRGELANRIDARLGTEPWAGSDRKIRRAIEHLRRAGWSITAAREGGYLLDDSAEGRAGLLAMYRTRALSELSTYRRMRRQFERGGAA